MLAAATALKPSSGRAVKTAISPPLRELSAPHPDAKSNLPALWVRENEDRPASLHPRETGDTDGALQPDIASPTGGMPAPIVSFDALNNEDNAAAFGGHVTPPDTDGAVGPTQYVQQVNLLLRVYDKTGAPLTPPTKLSSLFTALGGACAAPDNGDPVVLYDALADRWILSQFALPSFPNPPYHECIAVSTTGDATGTLLRLRLPDPGRRAARLPEALGLAGRVLHDGAPVHERCGLQRLGRVRARSREDARRRPGGVLRLLRPRPDQPPGGHLRHPRRRASTD